MQKDAVILQPDPDHASLVKALEPYKSMRVLHFNDMRHAYGAFPSEDYRKRYDYSYIA